jgi:hypothetical protein
VHHVHTGGKWSLRGVFVGGNVWLILFAVECGSDGSHLQGQRRQAGSVQLDSATWSVLDNLVFVRTFAVNAKNEQSDDTQR